MKRFVDMLREHPAEKVLAQLLRNEDRRKWDSLLPLYYGLYCSLTEKITDHETPIRYVLAGCRYEEDFDYYSIDIYEIDLTRGEDAIEHHSFERWEDFVIENLYIPEIIRNPSRHECPDISETAVIGCVIHSMREYKNVKRRSRTRLFRCAQKLCEEIHPYRRETLMMDEACHFFHDPEMTNNQVVMRECREVINHCSYLNWDDLLRCNSYPSDFYAMSNPWNPPDEDRCDIFCDQLRKLRCTRGYEFDDAREIYVTFPKYSEVPQVFVKEKGKENRRYMDEYSHEELLRMEICVEDDGSPGRENWNEWGLARILIWLCLYYLYPIRMRRQMREAAEGKMRQKKDSCFPMDLL